MISKTELGRVSKEIPGSGSGSGTRWALAASNPADSSQSRGKGAAGTILSPFPEVSVN